MTLHRVHGHGRGYQTTLLGMSHARLHGCACTRRRVCACPQCAWRPPCGLASPSLPSTSPLAASAPSLSSAAAISYHELPLAATACSSSLRRFCSYMCVPTKSTTSVPSAATMATTPGTGIGAKVRPGGRGPWRTRTAPRAAAADERDLDAGRAGDEDGRDGHHLEPQRRRQRGAQERRGRFDLTVKIRQGQFRLFRSL